MRDRSIVAEGALAAKRLRLIIERSWSWLAENDKQLLICFALIGGLYALFEYWSREDSEREQEVARYVQLQGEEHVASARAKLEVLMNGPEVSALKKETYGPFFEKLISDQDILAA